MYRAGLAHQTTPNQGKGVLGATHHLGRQCWVETPATLFLAVEARSLFLLRLRLDTINMTKGAPLKPHR